MVSILAYHGVEQTIPEKQTVCFAGREFRLNSLRVKLDSFRNQLQYLRRKGYRSVGLDEVLHARESGDNAKKRTVAITFDDGFSDLHLPTRYILEEFGYTATVFLVAERITDEGRNGFLTWKQVREMKRAGFSFGAHTLTHPFLSSLDSEEAFHEISESKRIIEEKLQTEVRFFCYPFGDFNQQVVERVKRAGFKGAVVTPTRPGVTETAFTMKRVGVNRGNSMLTFKLKLKGDYDVFRDSRVLFRFSHLRRRILLSLAREAL